MRHKVAKARVVTGDLTYVRYEFLIDDGVATVREQRQGAIVRTLVGAEMSAGVAGAQRVTGLDEQGTPTVWSIDRHGCQGCGGGMKQMVTPPDEIPQ